MTTGSQRFTIAPPNVIRRANMREVVELRYRGIDVKVIFNPHRLENSPSQHVPDFFVDVLLQLTAVVSQIQLSDTETSAPNRPDKSRRRKG